MTLYAVGYEAPPGTGDWYVKIGFTAGGVGSVLRRVTTLQTGNPNRLQLLGVCDGGRNDEVWAHAWAEAVLGGRMCGEWFHVHVDDGDAGIHPTHALKHFVADRDSGELTGIVFPGGELDAAWESFASTAKGVRTGSDHRRVGASLADVERLLRDRGLL